MLKDQPRGLRECQSFQRARALRHFDAPCAGGAGEDERESRTRREALHRLSPSASGVIGFAWSTQRPCRACPIEMRDLLGQGVTRGLRLPKIDQSGCATDQRHGGGPVSQTPWRAATACFPW